MAMVTHKSENLRTWWLATLQYLASAVVRHVADPSDPTLTELAKAIGKALERYGDDADRSRAADRILAGLADEIADVYRVVSEQGGWDNEQREVLRAILSRRSMLPDTGDQQRLLAALSPSVATIRRDQGGRPRGPVQTAAERVGSARPTLLSTLAGQRVNAGARGQRSMMGRRTHRQGPPPPAGSPSQVQDLLLDLLFDALDDDLRKRCLEQILQIYSEHERRYAEGKR